MLRGDSERRFIRFISRIYLLHYSISVLSIVIFEVRAVSSSGRSVVDMNNLCFCWALLSYLIILTCPSITNIDIHLIFIIKINPITEIFLNKTRKRSTLKSRATMNVVAIRQSIIYDLLSTSITIQQRSIVFKNL